jgi:hypothetical protein
VEEKGGMELGKRYPRRRELKDLRRLLLLVDFDDHYVLASTFGASCTYEPWDMNDLWQWRVFSSPLCLLFFIFTVSRFEGKIERSGFSSNRNRNIANLQPSMYEITRIEINHPSNKFGSLSL